MRITGGLFRSRLLLAPRGHTTRPTSDRVREALFGILTSAALLEGSHVLDLYAGTGALGLEALSRGATDAVFIESDRSALACLRENVAALGVGARARVLSSDVRLTLRRMASVSLFDLVLADPPWALVDQGHVAPVLSELARSSLLVRGALVVLEHAARSTPPEIDYLARGETRDYGDTALTFYKTAILGSPSSKPLEPTSE